MAGKSQLLVTFTLVLPVFLVRILAVLEFKSFEGEYCGGGGGVNDGIFVGDFWRKGTLLGWGHRLVFYVYYSQSNISYKRDGVDVFVQIQPCLFSSFIISHSTYSTHTAIEFLVYLIDAGEV